MVVFFWLQRSNLSYGLLLNFQNYYHCIWGGEGGLTGNLRYLGWMMRARARAYERKTNWYYCLPHERLEHKNIYSSSLIVNIHAWISCFIVFIREHNTSDHIVIYVNLWNHWFDSTNRLLFSFFFNSEILSNGKPFGGNDLTIFHSWLMTWYDMIWHVLYLHLHKQSSLMAREWSRENKYYNDKLYCIMIMTAEI